jgi:hypothetical protein
MCEHARMWRWIKRLIGAGVVAGAVYALWRVLDERSRSSELKWTPQPFPSPPRPEVREGTEAAAPATAPREEAAVPDPPPTPQAAPQTAPAWVEPTDGTCPATHPVKAKISSGIFHEPGGQMYDRTHPDRCYESADAAIADGLRASQR